MKIEDLHQGQPEQYCIFDSHDIFDQLNETILLAGEQPAVDFNDEGEVQMFMFDLFSNVGHLPTGYAVNIGGLVDVVIRDAHDYLTTDFTPLQTKLWYNATADLIKRFHSFQMYEATTSTHRYDFEDMVGSDLLLKLYA